MMISRLAAAALLVLPLNACVPAMVAGTAARVAAQSAMKADKAEGGPIYHYVRSNRDGSEPENIVHFRPSASEVAVYKWVSKCSSAAYVTAEMRPGIWEPLTLHAGKVSRTGTQDRFGTLSLDPSTRELSVIANLDGKELRDRASVPQGLPWFLYDYDLADLNAYLQEVRPTDDFQFAFALFMPGPDGDGPLNYFATMEADYLGQMIHEGRGLRRFDLTSSDGEPMRGTLWVDPASGAIVEAEFDRKNHDFMTDYRLKLARVEAGGSAQWKALLAAHWANCPV